MGFWYWHDYGEKSCTMINLARPTSNDELALCYDYSVVEFVQPLHRSNPASDNIKHFYFYSYCVGQNNRSLGLLACKGPQRATSQTRLSLPLEYKGHQCAATKKLGLESQSHDINIDPGACRNGRVKSPMNWYWQTLCPPCRCVYLCVCVGQRGNSWLYIRWQKDCLYSHRFSF